MASQNNPNSLAVEDKPLETIPSWSYFLDEVSDDAMDTDVVIDEGRKKVVISLKPGVLLDRDEAVEELAGAMEGAAIGPGAAAGSESEDGGGYWGSFEIFLDVVHQWRMNEDCDELEIDISHNVLLEKEAKMLAEELRCMRNLTAFTARAVTSTIPDRMQQSHAVLSTLLCIQGIDCVLERIDVSSNPILGDVMSIYLAPILTMHSETMEYLNISNCGLTGFGLNIIGGALAAEKNKLGEVSLAGNHIGIPGQDKTALTSDEEILALSLGLPFDLSTLNFNPYVGVVDIITTFMHNVEGMLVLDHTGIGGNTLAQAVSPSPSTYLVTGLSLKGVEWGQDTASVQPFMLGLSTGNVERLSIFGMTMSENVARAFGAALIECPFPFLRSLDFSAQPFGPVIVECVDQAVAGKRLPTLCNLGGYDGFDGKEEYVYGNLRKTLQQRYVDSIAPSKTFNLGQSLARPPNQQLQELSIAWAALPVVKWDLPNKLAPTINPNSLPPIHQFVAPSCYQKWFFHRGIATFISQTVAKSGGSYPAAWKADSLSIYRADHDEQHMFNRFVRRFFEDVIAKEIIRIDPAGMGKLEWNLLDEVVKYATSPLVLAEFGKVLRVHKLFRYAPWDCVWYFTKGLKLSQVVRFFRMYILAIIEEGTLLRKIDPNTVLAPYFTAQNLPELRRLLEQYQLEAAKRKAAWEGKEKATT